jgi:adenosylhomocysteine nucleosidase
MTGARDTVWAGRSIAVGFLEDEPVILVGSGVGTTNAAITLQYICNHYPVQGVLFTGICGGLASQVKIGDIVIPDRWVTHDYGYLGAMGFESDSIDVGVPGIPGFSHVLELPVDEQLQDRLCRAAYAAAEDFKPVVDRMVQISCGGVGATGNQFIDQTEKRDWLVEQFHADIVDMESAAVLQTAVANGVPCVIIRSASDLAGGSGSATAAIELREFFKIAADNSAAVVRSYFRMLHLGTFELQEAQKE